MITIQPVTPPTISVNGSPAPAKEVQYHDQVFAGNRDSFTTVGNNGHSNVLKVFSPATITMTGPTGAEIRYTFNSKKVNLGSKLYDPNNKPVVYNGGNGFDGEVLTIRAKAYLNGEVSKTTECVLHVINTGNPGQTPPEVPNTTQTYKGDVDQKWSKTGK